MNEKFKNLPVEEDTQIIASFETKVESYDVVYQKWYWGGIYAESIIFFNDDVANLSEEQIKNEVAENTALLKDNSQMTLKKGENYTFVNFNFITA
ncbi:hypothetical protein [Winogradskyella sp.]|uniref:hypothetical protein n=1 Tax=Winogradskyella sp. TaxID=1883156 RepID=UPI003AB68E7A